MAMVLWAERLGLGQPGVVGPAVSVASVVARDRGIFIFQRDTGRLETSVTQCQAQAQAHRVLRGNRS